MSFALTDAEWAGLATVADDDLVELLADMGSLLPAPPLDRRTILGGAVASIVAHGLAEGGLPFSKYDLDDLRALDAAGLAALARIQGLKPPATPEAILKVGERVYRQRARTHRTRDGFAFMIPILLAPIVRCAIERGLDRSGA